MAPEVWFPNLFNIQIERINRTAFSLFGMNVYWYGIILTLGVALGVITVIYLAKKTGQSADLYEGFAFVVIIAGIIGARLYYVIFNWSIFADDPLQIFNLRSGGLGLYGIVIAGLIAAFFYARVKKLSLFTIIDTCAPALVLGQAVGRWGNFVNKEVFGGYTDSLFAMRLLKSQVPQSNITPDIAAHISDFGTGAEYIQVHPAFLYESALCFVIFAFLFFYVRRKKFNGEIFCYYALLYGIGRFLIEGIRTDQLFFWGTNIPVSQIVAAVSVILALGAILYNYSKLRSKTKQDDETKNKLRR